MQTSSLIFFALACCLACRQAERSTVQILYAGDKATGISIPKKQLPAFEQGTTDTSLQVRVAHMGSNAMLGSFHEVDDAIRFTPIVPFTPGLQYKLYLRNEVIDSFYVPVSTGGKAASVTAIYPSADTLPDNLLKLYVQFSTPMREGVALQHIHLLHAGDTLQEVFLDLQPELWNKESTVLTLWLDPGRIKRDLQPNQRLGNPLQFGEQYTVAIDKEWKDASERPLTTSYTKTFVVGARDSLMPLINNWQILPPQANTTTPLVIQFGEPMDYFLAIEKLQLKDHNESVIGGLFKMGDSERTIQFTPTAPWKKGEYILQAAAVLEDVAGNNLNKPFDRDLLVKQASVPKPIHERTFTVQ